MKRSDIKKLDSKTQEILATVLDIGFKPREIGVYTMYANVHITLPRGLMLKRLKRIVDIMPENSSLHEGNNFRSGLTIRLPWNLPSKNYEKRQTVFDR